jgi:O-antigen ligase
MSHSVSLSQSENALPLGAAAAPASPNVSVRAYLGIITLVAAPAGLAMIVGYLAGNTMLGAIIGIVPTALLVLWRPEIGVFVFTLYVPFSYFGFVAEDTSAAKVLGLYIGVVLILHLIGRHQFKMKAVALWLAMIFVVWNILSIIGARQPGAAWVEIITMSQMVFLLFVVLNACTTSEQVETFAWCLFFGGAIAACGGFFMTPVEGHRALADVRLSLGGQDTNQFTKEIMPAIFLMPYLATRVRRGLKPMVWGLGLIVLVAIVMASSRSSYFGAGAGILVAVLTYRSLGWGKRMALVVAMVAALTVIIFLGIAFGFFSQELLVSRFTELQKIGLGTGNRATFWNEAIRLGFEHPILGVGSGNFIFWMSDKGYIKAAHNDYLSVFADTGVPGLVFFVGFLLATLGRAWRCASPVLRAGCIGMWIAQMVACMGNPSMHSKGFWLQAAGCILVGTALATSPSAATPTPASLAVGPLKLSRRP